MESLTTEELIGQYGALLNGRIVLTDDQVRALGAELKRRGVAAIPAEKILQILRPANSGRELPLEEE